MTIPMETDADEIQGFFGEGSLNAMELQGAIYDELRQIAAKKMASEQSGHILQPTALVNEAYLRLCQSDDERLRQRPYFFAAAAQIGWTGRDGRAVGQGYTLALSELVWKNPHPDKTIATIDFISAKAKAAPFLVGITLE